MNGPMFADAARQLGGDAALLLGWRPDEFWTATPADLATALEPMRQVTQAGAMDGAALRTLQEQFPDG